MDNFYKKCQNLSKNAGILEEKDAQTETKKEQGRSMVEMLGVLAIIGVLSIGAISGYRYAMNKYRANQVTNELNLLSHQVAAALMSKNGVAGALKLGEPYDTTHKLSASGYGFWAGCGNSITTPECSGQTQYYMKVKNLSKDVCQEVAQTAPLMQYYETRESGALCQSAENDLLLVFNTELNSTETGAETDTVAETTAGSGINIGSTPSEALNNEFTPDCNGHGYSFYYACSCYVGYIGLNCEIEASKPCNGTCSGEGEYCLVSGNGGSNDPAIEFADGSCHVADDDKISVTINGDQFIVSRNSMDSWSAKRFCEALSGNHHLATKEELKCSATCANTTEMRSTQYWIDGGELEWPSGYVITGGGYKNDPLMVICK